ncbi:pyridoxal-phosphate dependent enzyme [Enterobacter hormaechei]
MEAERRLPESGAGCRASCRSAARRAVCRGRGGEAHWRRNVPPVCQEYLDDIVTVDSDAICAAMKNLFEDVRAVAEPSGALALAGMKKYIAQHNIRGERLAHVLSGADVNFHGLRYVSERCELGEQREALLAVTIPEEKGSFLKFCQLLGGRSVTEFNYRFADAKDACIFVGVRLSRGVEAQRDPQPAARRRLQRGRSL